MSIFEVLIILAGYTTVLFLDQEVDINKNNCNIIGGSGTFSKLTQLQHNLSHCVDEHSKGIPINKINVAKIPIYHTSCLGRQAISGCYEPLISASKQCLNITESYLVDIWQNIDKELIAYTCKNEDKVQKYTKEYTAECMNEGILKIQEKCLGLSSNPMSPMREMSQITCKKFEDAEDCIMETLSNHCSQNITDVVVSVIKILKTNACSYAPKHRSRRSLHRVVRQLAMSDKMDRIEEHLKTKCIKNGLDSKKLEDSVTKMKSCIKEKPLFLTPKHIYIKHVDGCTKEVIKTLKACLPEKYKYLPQLIFDVFDSMISFMYDDFILISSELTPCLPKLKSEESTTEYNECNRKVTDIVEDELVESKEKFCERYIHLNECFIAQVKKQCAPSAELTKFEKDYMNAVKKPCE